jgi:hypothetical protein
MAFLITIFLNSIIIITCSAKLGSSQVAIPPFLVDDDSCQQRSAVLQLTGYISAITAGLKLVPQCGEGLWYQVAYLNMSDSTQVCPSNWVEIHTPVRTCGRPTSAGRSCPGVQYSVNSLQYSKVCGRVVGYQDGSSDAFYPGQSSSSPDDIYVDGVSLTHGMPREHIWTFAVGGTDGSLGDNDINCPCFNPAATSNIFPPSFVGNNYFCESGNHGRRLGGREIFFVGDPVWDGQQCEGECCSSTGISAPWFHASLPKPTTDDIEIRICASEGTHNEDSPIQMFEIYIQ